MGNFMVYFDCSTNTVERFIMRTKIPELSREKEMLILTAAQKRFAVYGLTKVTMDEIADDVGMGKASLYYYFPTKEDIFRGVIKKEQQEFLQRMHAVVGENFAASKKLETYVKQRLKLASQLLNLSSLNYSSWMALKPIFKDLFNGFEEEECKILTHIVREGKRSLEFGGPSPEKLAQLILHILQGMRLRLIRESGPAISVQSYEELEREMILFIEILLHGISQHKTH
jgi:TetR/AcrR family transcriptional regulator